jgi:hypothetical protein
MSNSFDVYLLEDGALMVGRPKGVLDGELATKIVEFVEIKEALIETGFNRFCDMTRLTGVNLALNEIDAMAIRRREFNPNFVHVKSAFLALHPLTWGIVELYRSLLQSPRIEVRGFESIELAAEWLGVSAEKLRL